MLVALYSLGTSLAEAHNGSYPPPTQQIPMMYFKTKTILEKAYLLPALI